MRRMPVGRAESFPKWGECPSCEGFRGLRDVRPELGQGSRNRKESSSPNRDITRAAAANEAIAFCVRSF